MFLAASCGHHSKQTSDIAGRDQVVDVKETQVLKAKIKSGVYLKVKCKDGRQEVVSKKDFDAGYVCSAEKKFFEYQDALNLISQDTTFLKRIFPYIEPAARLRNVSYGTLDQFNAYQLEIFEKVSATKMHIENQALLKCKKNLLNNSCKLETPTFMICTGACILYSIASGFTSDTTRGLPMFNSSF